LKAEIEKIREQIQNIE
ncbi:MAG: DUF1732 domain-containing protein, partial [Ruminococcus sp.]|nr:DUF1732 domain-containing protein [Ruminococcus sp.]